MKKNCKFILEYVLKTYKQKTCVLTYFRHKSPLKTRVKIAKRKNSLGGWFGRVKKKKGWMEIKKKINGNKVELKCLSEEENK